MSEHHDDHLAGPEQRKRIWMVFWLLAAVTTVEFIIAFAMGRGVGRNLLFIGLTLFKAFYIVAEFMHLKHEVKALVMTILLPLLFIMWMILALLIEGTFASPEHGGWFAI